MNPVLSIFKKEVTELFRDKRVRSSAIFGPMFMVLIFMVLFGFLGKTLGEPKSQKIHVVKTDNMFIRMLKDQKTEVKEVGSEEEARKLVKEGSARVVLEFEPDYDAKVLSGSQTEIRAFFNPDQEISQFTLGSMEKAFNEANKKARETLLSAKGIDPTSVEPIRFKSISVKEEKAGASEILVSLLPYLVVLWAFYGGISSASELVAGEKEKNTLETLLIAPIKRSEIAYGKFLALMSVCLLGSLSCVVGLLLAPKLPLPGLDTVFKHGGGVTLPSVLTLLLIVLPCAGLFASILLAISTNSRNQREAQTQITLASFVVLMPAMFSQFIGYTDFANARWISLVPILNSANTIRHALQGKLDGVEIGLTMLVNIVLAVAAMLIAIQLFQRERVLARV